MSKIKIALVSCMLILPQMAVAKDHYVIITGFGFFPQTSYVKPGDVIHFKNDDGFQHNLAGGSNENNPWSIEVQPYATASMDVTGVSSTTYNSVNSPLAPAQISFEDPPVEATAD